MKVDFLSIYDSFSLVISPLHDNNERYNPLKASKWRRIMMNHTEQWLKNELNKLRAKNEQLFQDNVLPLINAKRHEFLDSFEDFFRDRGFVIKKSADSVRASYDTLHFKAFLNENGEMIIMKGREQIAGINVSFDSSFHLNQEKMTGKSVSLLEKEFEKEQILSSTLENPICYYSGRNSDIRFENPDSVLENIFLT